jgi:outer membrane protein assembly factor BamB
MRQQSRPNVPSALSGCVICLLLLISGCGTQNGTGVQPTPTPSPAQTLARLSVYATADGGALVALKADGGQRRWQGQTGTLAGGKPVVDQGIVFAGSKDTIYAFNTSNGAALWNHFEPGQVLSLGPIEADGRVYVNSSTGLAGEKDFVISVVALKSSDGSLLWRSQVDTRPLLPLVAFSLLGQFVVKGTVYIAVLLEDPAHVRPSQLQVYAYKADDGNLLWRSSLPPPQGGAGGSSALLVDKNVAYLYYDRVYALKVSDGTLLWYTQSGRPMYIGPVGFVVDRGTIVTASDSGVYAYRESDGTMLWEAPSRMGVYDIATANGTLYATTGQAIVALDISTGKQLWQYAPGGAGLDFSTILVGGNTVYSSKFSGGLVALDVSSGNLRWQAQAGGNGNRPELGNGVLFIGSAEATISAFNASNGKLLWRYIISDTAMSFPSALAVGP